MLRLLLTPRWIAATLLTLVAVGVCVALGAWQWDRAHREPRPIPVADERVVALPDVVAQPAEVPFPSGLLVRGTGRYGPNGFVATGLDATDARAAWAVAPLVLDAGSGTVAVVRGAARPVPSRPVSGDVVVTGRLQPPAPPGVGGLTAAALSARGVDPRGYLVLTAQAPTDVAPPIVVSSPVPLVASGLRWQNSVYAVQWWMFGCFAVFAWVRFFREDLAESRYPPGV